MNQQDAERVDEVFMTWCHDLVEHHGDKPVASVLSSPAIQAMFSGEVGQFLVDPPVVEGPDDPVNIAMHPAIVPAFRSWLAGRGLRLSPPIPCSDGSTFRVISPDSP